MVPGLRGPTCPFKTTLVLGLRRHNRHPDYPYVTDASSVSKKYQRQLECYRDRLRVIHSLGLYQWPARVQLLAAVFSIPGLVAVLARLRGYDPADTAALFSRSVTPVAAVAIAISLLLGGWVWHRFSLGRALSSVAAGLVIIASWVLLAFAGGPALLLSASLILLFVGCWDRGCAIRSVHQRWMAALGRSRCSLICAPHDCRVFSCFLVANGISGVRNCRRNARCVVLRRRSLGAVTNHHLGNEATSVLKAANKLDQLLSDATRDVSSPAVVDRASRDPWPSVQAALLGSRPEEAIHLFTCLHSASSDCELHECRERFRPRRVRTAVTPNPTKSMVDGSGTI